jgi:hypothetical protein
MKYTYRLLSSLIFLLYIGCNSSLAQLEPDEQPATAVGIGGLKTAYYEKCTGNLYINLQTSHDAANIFPIYKAYIYLKVGGQWKNMLTIRGEDSWDDNGATGTNCTNGIAWNAAYAPVFNGIVTPGTNPGNPCRRVAGGRHLAHQT